MKATRLNILRASLLSSIAALPACTTTSDGLANGLADGTSLRAIVIAQTDDPFAGERNGTRAPQGTDPEVAAAAIKGLRERGSSAGSKPGLFDILFGGMSGK